jgi:hypothetical protein
VIDVRDDGDVAKFLSHSGVPGKPTIIERWGGSRLSFAVSPLFSTFYDEGDGKRP